MDLLHDVVGLRRDQRAASVVTVPLPGTDVAVRVMHPLDALQSRNANLPSSVSRSRTERANFSCDWRSDRERRRAIFDVIGTVAENPSRTRPERMSPDYVRQCEEWAARGLA